jgi:hypothetical protein
MVALLGILDSDVYHFCIYLYPLRKQFKLLGISAHSHVLKSFTLNDLIVLFDF